MPKKDELDARLSQEDIVPLYNSGSSGFSVGKN
jgi:hypothetical protein